MKDFDYVGIVGRGGTAASGAVNRKSLDFVGKCRTYSFRPEAFYENMLLHVAEEVVSALRAGKDAVIYTVDSVADTAEAMKEAIRTKEDACSVAERLIVKGGEGEKQALKLLYQALKLSESLKPVIKVAKAKEMDMLLLDLPEGYEPEPETALDFVDGTAQHGVRIHGWHNYNRRGARVKVKFTAGRKVYFVYRNDRSALGIARGNLIRYLWALTPNTVEAKNYAG